VHLAVPQMQSHICARNLADPRVVDPMYRRKVARFYQKIGVNQLVAMFGVFAATEQAMRVDQNLVSPRGELLAPTSCCGKNVIVAKFIYVTTTYC